MSDNKSKKARKNEKDEVPDPDHVPTNETGELSSEDSPRNEKDERRSED